MGEPEQEHVELFETALASTSQDRQGSQPQHPRCRMGSILSSDTNQCYSFQLNKTLNFDDASNLCLSKINILAEPRNSSQLLDVQNLMSSLKGLKGVKFDKTWVNVKVGLQGSKGSIYEWQTTPADFDLNLNLFDGTATPLLGNCLTQLATTGHWANLKCTDTVQNFICQQPSS